MQRPLVAAVVGASACIALAGCGSGGRPSVSQIESGLVASGNPDHGAAAKKMTHCLATHLHDSKGISDAMLHAIVDKKQHYKPSKTEDKAAGKIMMSCMKGGIPDVLGSLSSSSPSPK